jgi:hypothetical protein
MPPTAGEGVEQCAPARVAGRADVAHSAAQVPKADVGPGPQVDGQDTKVQHRHRSCILIRIIEVPTERVSHRTNAGRNPGLTFRHSDRIAPAVSTSPHPRNAVAAEQINRPAGPDE